MLYSHPSAGVPLALCAMHSSACAAFLTVARGLGFSVSAVPLSRALYKVSWYYCRFGAFTRVSICVLFRLISNVVVTNLYAWQMRGC